MLISLLNLRYCNSCLARNFARHFVFPIPVSMICLQIPPASQSPTDGWERWGRRCLKHRPPPHLTEAGAGSACEFATITPVRVALRVENGLRDSAPSHGWRNCGRRGPRIAATLPAPCDRTVKLNGLIKRNGHHLNASGALA